MIIRLRSRDGLERIEVGNGATLAQLKHAIQAKLGVPLEDMLLSKNAALLTAKEEQVPSFTDMQGDGAPLQQLGVAHGDMVFLLYHFEREVQPAVKKSDWEKRPFGAHMDVAKMVSLQTRIERQEAPHAGSASFDFAAANLFQSYVSSAIAFSIKRGGILYGTVDEEGHVFVNAIYEPPQQGSADSLQLERGTEEERQADFVAERLGWKKVGWIFAQSTKEREFIMSNEEICQMAAIQDEMGEHAVTAVVATWPGEDEQPEVHFEVFQVSDQCVKLWRDGWFQEQQGEPSGASQLRNPKDPKDETPVIVAGKDQGEVDTDYFLIPVAVRDHEGPLENKFPVENRLLPQGTAELKSHLAARRSKPYWARLADFHLLLYLARQPNFEEAEVGVLVDAVREQATVPEGFQLIIDSMAGLH
ncbi:NPL4 1 [Micractinium conductrix]|uniref:NPL4 1 n=1 Tax=Micractinium conductrix TaxID=554055 RepID=A0A2P6VFV6_9CHLO|nr:NPL4 1 [Micractinium conductrix]|eukprot:PSC72970.1 NPL4 1 [Micractinium conductrix]